MIPKSKLIKVFIPVKQTIIPEQTEHHFRANSPTKSTEKERLDSSAEALFVK